MSDQSTGGARLEWARAYAATIAAGTKPNLARLTLARHIAAAVLAMWKNKEKYDLSKQQR